jgi:hypothetical protein
VMRRTLSQGNGLNARALEDGRWPRIMCQYTEAICSHTHTHTHSHTHTLTHSHTHSHTHVHTDTHTHTHTHTGFLQGSRAIRSKCLVLRAPTTVERRCTVVARTHEQRGPANVGRCRSPARRVEELHTQHTTHNTQHTTHTTHTTYTHNTQHTQDTTP